ncbi:Uncharacterised protein [Mycobacteroides abscessus subsp. abscessus]|nr:Uncharacterised protein [Mycobacteroides abscessus subsp. abscessus]SIL71957.1 Uncharacterised protein [Mycobacteroides abscessus subsp. abscessus]SKT94531.1 Uncharacterised protein [Mycobacteroides abscessus subsp. abscessus]
MSSRKVPETAVPNTPVHCCSDECSSETLAANVLTPSASNPTMMNTIEECPSENQKPTDIGRRPSATSLRVVLSMAAM